MLNELRRLLEQGQITPMEFQQQENLLKEMLMPQPRYDIAPMQQNTMRVENGPEAGKVIPMDFQQAAPQESRRPPGMEDLGDEVEVPGRGRGRYTAGGRKAVGLNSDGSVKWIQDLFPQKTAFEEAQRFKRELAETELQNKKLSGLKTGEEIVSSQNKRLQEQQEQEFLRGGKAPEIVPQSLLEKRYGKAPDGMRWTINGQTEVIPGGKAEMNAQKEQERVAKGLERADLVLGSVGEALNQTGAMTAGLIGGLTRGVPGTPAYDLNKTIDTIKANIGFGELQAMREASPTGGALGQVAVQELSMLQSVLGSLDTAQSPDQLRKSLQAIQSHYNNWKNAVQQSKAQPQANNQEALIAEAKAAIAKGAPEAAVRQRLMQMGVSF